jgi:hypothetical protein
MDASRGRGNRGRGANRGRGGGRPRGDQGVPLAAQMRQLDRLQEPEEMAVFRRHKDLDLLQIRSTYTPGGLVECQALVPASTLAKAGRAAEAAAWLSMLDVENLSVSIKTRMDRERAMARRGERLGAPFGQTAWVDLTDGQRRVLLMSQKEYNSFRASRSGGTVPPRGGQAATTPPPVAAQPAGAQSATRGRQQSVPADHGRSAESSVASTREHSRANSLLRNELKK